jgi:hypothetical protein
MAIIIDTDFPGGGARDIRIEAGRTENEDALISFSSPTDGALFGETLWFAFRIRGAAGKRLAFIQRDMTHTLGGQNYAFVRPVVREGKGDAYRRVPEADTFFIPDPISFTFRMTPQSGETYVFFCFPYQYEDLKNFAAGFPALKTVYLCKTSEGRDYPALIAGDDGGKDKKLLVASARQHSGETPGSFVLEGFIRAYFGNDEGAKKLREKTVLIVLPMVNLDGVEEGRYGKNAPPEDFNRAWCTRTCRGEIRAFLDLLEEKLKIYRSGFYIDFHAPGPEARSYVVPGYARIAGKDGWKRINLFIDLLEELTQDRAPYRRIDIAPDYINWSGDNYRLTSRDAFIENFGFDGVSLETSYHLDHTGKPLYPEDWRYAGTKVVEAVRRVWFEGYDRPDVPTATREQFWDGWEMTAFPRDVTIEAAPGSFGAESTGNSAFASFSDYREIRCREEGAYSLECQGACNLVCFAYYRSEGKVTGRGKLFTVNLNNEKALLPFSYFRKDEFEKFRTVFRINSLKGTLKINQS